MQQNHSNMSSNFSNMPSSICENPEDQDKILNISDDSIVIALNK